jgi:hypothetical protein
MCRFCVTDGVPRRSFVVALVVGTILNLINQGDALFEGGQVNIAKIILTYAVLSSDAKCNTPADLISAG